MATKPEDSNVTSADSGIVDRSLALENVSSTSEQDDIIATINGPPPSLSNGLSHALLESAVSLPTTGTSTHAQPEVVASNQGTTATPVHFPTVESTSEFSASCTTHLPPPPTLSTPITTQDCAAFVRSQPMCVRSMSASSTMILTQREVNDLKSELAEKEEEIQQLKRERDLLQDENLKKDYQLEIELEKSEQNLQDALSKAEQDKESNNRTIDSKNEKIAQLEKEIRKLKNKLKPRTLSLDQRSKGCVHQENPFISLQHEGCRVISLKKCRAQAPNNKAKHLKTLERLLNSKYTVDIRCLNLFFLGPPFVGKTTTRDRLLKVIVNISLAKADPNYSVESTLLANCNQVLASISKEEWVCSKNIHEEAQLVFALIKEVVEFDEDISESSTSTITISDDKLTQKPVQESTQPVVERLKDMITHNDYSKFEKMFGNTLLNIHDIGGQPCFLEMLPALIRGPAMYLLCFKMSVDLNKPYPIRFNRHELKEPIESYESEHSVLSTLSQLLSSIATIQHASSETTPKEIKKLPGFKNAFPKLSETCPAAAFIGTFKDEVNPSQYKSKVQSINQTLSSLIRQFLDKSSIKIMHHHNEKFFSFDNLNGNDAEDVALLRKFLVWNFEIHFKNAELKIDPTWLLFGIILRNEYTIAKLTDCLKIGEALSMNEVEVKLCLWYLHQYVGILMYFPGLPDEWFKNYVICSPQVVFDSISQLLLASLSKLSSEGPGVDAHEQIYWIEKGQFSLTMIKSYFSSNVEQDQVNLKLIPVEKLVKLLDYLNLLSPVFSTSSVQSEDQIIRYFMPAALKCAPHNTFTSSPKPDDNNPEPLFIAFKCGYVPTGVFCGLVSCLVSRGAQTILGLHWKLGKDVKLNCVSFLVDHVHMVTLLCHEKCYEIRLVRQLQEVSESLHDLCTYVISAILYVLSTLYPGLVPIMAFKCSCSVHGANSDTKTFDLCSMKIGFRINFVCEKDKPSTLRKYQEVWMGKHVTLGGSESLEVLKYCRRDFSYFWTKSGSKSKKPISTESEILLKNISQKNSGYYQCNVLEQERVVFVAFRALFIVDSPEQPSSTHKEPDEKSPELLRLCEDYNLNDDDIDQHVSDDHIRKIYRRLLNWKLVAKHLQLTDSQIEEIECAERDYMSMKFRMLQVWKRKSKIRGTDTYRVLLEALLNFDDCVDLVIYVCQLLQGHTLVV